MLVGPSQGLDWRVGGGAAAGRLQGAWRRYLQSSRRLGQAISVKQRKKKEIKEEKGPAPAGMVGIPAASSLAERVGALPPEA